MERSKNKIPKNFIEFMLIQINLQRNIQINIHRKSGIKTNSFTFFSMIYWYLKESLFKGTCQVID